MSDKPCHSHATHHVLTHTLWSKKKTDNAPIDNTEQVTLGMKQSLSYQILYFFLRNSNNKYCFVAVNVSWPIAVAACEPIISSSSLVTARNKQMNIKRYLVSTAERCQYTQFFKSKSTNVNLLSCLVCLLHKNSRFGDMIGQIACQSNSLRRVNYITIINTAITKVIYLFLREDIFIINN